MSENGDCPCVYVTCQFAEVGCTHAVLNDVRLSDQ